MFDKVGCNLLNSGLHRYRFRLHSPYELTQKKGEEEDEQEDEEEDVNCNDKNAVDEASCAVHGSKCVFAPVYTILDSYMQNVNFEFNHKTSTGAKFLQSLSHDYTQEFPGDKFETDALSSPPVQPGPREEPRSPPHKKESAGAQYKEFRDNELLLNILAKMKKLNAMIETLSNFENFKRTECFCRGSLTYPGCSLGGSQKHQPTECLERINYNTFSQETRKNWEDRYHQLCENGIKTSIWNKNIPAFRPGHLPLGNQLYNARCKGCIALSKCVPKVRLLYAAATRVCQLYTRPDSDPTSEVFVADCPPIPELPGLGRDTSLVVGTTTGLITAVQEEKRTHRARIQKQNREAARAYLLNKEYRENINIKEPPCARLTAPNIHAEHFEEGIQVGNTWDKKKERWTKNLLLNLHPTKLSSENKYLVTAEPNLNSKQQLLRIGAEPKLLADIRDVTVRIGVVVLIECAPPCAELLRENPALQEPCLTKEEDDRWTQEQAAREAQGMAREEKPCPGLDPHNPRLKVWRAQLVPPSGRSKVWTEKDLEAFPGPVFPVEPEVDNPSAQNPEAQRIKKQVLVGKEAWITVGFHRHRSDFSMARVPLQLAQNPRGCNDAYVCSSGCCYGMAGKIPGDYPKASKKGILLGTCRQSKECMGVINAAVLNQKSLIGSSAEKALWAKQKFQGLTGQQVRYKVFAEECVPICALPEGASCNKNKECASGCCKGNVKGTILGTCAATTKCMKT